MKHRNVGCYHQNIYNQNTSSCFLLCNLKLLRGIPCLLLSILFGNHFHKVLLPKPFFLWSLWLTCCWGSLDRIHAQYVAWARQSLQDGEQLLQVDVRMEAGHA